MPKEYWDKKHATVYRQADWSNKPSIFSTQAIKYFPPSGKILDIGTGQGNDAEYFHKLGFEVVATDFSPVAVSDARAKVKGVEFLEVDTSKGLPFQDEYFDVVYSHMALHYFDEKTTKKIFEDIYRILKPGGIFATIANTALDPEKETASYTRLEAEFYEEAGGTQKRYFSEAGMKRFTDVLFETLLLDSQGRTYKDTNLDSLIRFIGKKR